MDRSLALSLACVAAVACGGGAAADPYAEPPFQLFDREGLGGDGVVSLVVIVSPGSCVLFGDDLRRLAALGERGIGVRLAFVADRSSPEDSAQVQTAVQGFGLEVPYAIVDEAEYLAHVSAPLGLRTPLFLLARHNATVAAFGNLDPRHALTVIESILGEE